MFRSYLISAIVLASFHPCPAQDVQARAQELLQRASQLSDIRSLGAPAFRLKATFSFVGDDLETVKGTYIETRVSGSQWRRETVIGDLHQVDVGGAGKHWLLYPDGFPSRADQLPFLLEAVPPASTRFDFEAVVPRGNAGINAQCAVVKPVHSHMKAAFCFEGKTGLLLQKVFPEHRPRNEVSLSCGYGAFHEFGGHWFPYEVVCSEDRHETISAKVLELSLEPQPDPALFIAPPGAIELGECSGKVVAPAPVGNESPLFFSDLDHTAWVSLWLVVDVKGRPQNVRLLRPLGKGDHKDELKRFQTLRFWPGTCDGKAMAMQFVLEVPTTPR